MVIPVGVAAACLVGVFFLGVQTTRYHAEWLYPTHNSVSLWSHLALDRVRQVMQQPPAPAMLAARNTNTFVTRSYQPGLKGTVLLTLRPPDGQNEGYESRIVEVNRAGVVVWEYRAPWQDDSLIPISEARKLPNGNVSFPASNLAAFRAYVAGILAPGAFNGVVEVNRAGEVVRRIAVPVTHHAEWLPNGHLLTVSAVRNAAYEVDAEGRVIWSWLAAEHIQPYSDRTFSGFGVAVGPVRNGLAEGADRGYLYRNLALDDWTHINSAQRLANGNTVLSLRNLDLVVEVNPQGEAVWTYGPLALKQQHCAWILENGNLLVTDNGNARVIEVERATQRIVWEYKEGLLMPDNACACRLPSGNTLITDSYHRRVVEVTPQKQVAWELVVQNPTFPLYRAWWYAD